MSTSAMHVAKTGLTAQQYKMQVIANNLANVNTTGFKRDRANFETLFYQKEIGRLLSRDEYKARVLSLEVGLKEKEIQTPLWFI